MLTIEQQEMIRNCFNSYRGWGEQAPEWFTCRIVLETSGLRELPFCDVYGYINQLQAEHENEWIRMKTIQAQQKNN